MRSESISELHPCTLRRKHSANLDFCISRLDLGAPESDQDFELFLETVKPFVFSNRLIEVFGEIHSDWDKGTFKNFKDYIKLNIFIFARRGDGLHKERCNPFELAEQEFVSRKVDSNYIKILQEFQDELNLSLIHI